VTRLAAGEAPASSRTPGRIMAGCPR
jgi:hypothetical protein